MMGYRNIPCFSLLPCLEIHIKVLRFVNSRNEKINSCHYKHLFSYDFTGQRVVVHILEEGNLVCFMYMAYVYMYLYIFFVYISKIKGHHLTECFFASSLGGGASFGRSP